MISMILSRRGRTDIRVLIDGAGNEGRNIVAFTEDLGERVGEGRSCLNCSEMEHSDIVAKSSTQK